MKNSNYYRKITEVFPKALKTKAQKWVKKPLLKKDLRSFFVLFLLLAGIFLTIAVYLLAVKYAAVRQKREVLLDELTKWERVAAMHPNYTDAYFQAAYYAYEVRDNKKSLLYLQKALNLDPGFTAAQKLKNLIEEK